MGSVLGTKRRKVTTTTSVVKTKNGTSTSDINNNAAVNNNTNNNNGGNNENKPAQNEPSNGNNGQGGESKKEVVIADSGLKIGNLSGTANDKDSLTILTKDNNGNVITANMTNKPDTRPEAMAGSELRHLGNIVHISPNAEPVAEKPKVVLEGPFAEGSPLNKTISLFSICKSLFTLIQFIILNEDWNSEEFAETLNVLFNDLKKECVVICVHQDLRNWVFHLDGRKTGGALGSGKKISNSLNHIKELVHDIKEANGCRDVEQKAQFVASMKELLSLYLNFLNACELVVSANFAFEVNELAKTLRDVVDTATGKLNFIFDDIARICTTNSMRICRLGMWKSVQVYNTMWTRQLIDMALTVTRATNMMHNVGTNLNGQPADQVSFQQLTALTRGIVGQIKNIQMLTSAEPPMTQFMPYIDPSLILEYAMLYDVGIKDVTDSLTLHYAHVMNNHSKGDKTTKATFAMIEQVNIIKQQLTFVDVRIFLKAINTLTELVEQFCAGVYHDLSLIGDSNAVLKEQLMETMQICLHNCIHIQFVASSKALMHLTVNPEITLLTAVRLLLMCVSIIIEAVAYMKRTEIIENLDSTIDLPDDDVVLKHEDIKAAIVYILHFGRPTLYKGEGETEPEPEPNRPVIINNIMYPDGPPTNRKKIAQQDSETDETDDSSSYETTSSSETDSDESSDVVSKKPVRKPAEDKPANKPAQVAQEKPKEPEKPKASGQKIWLNPLEIPADIVLTMNPADYSVDNLPYGFEKAPCPKPGARRSDFSEDEYKAYMRQKYEYEAWENKLILWTVKLKRRIDEVKPK